MHGDAAALVGQQLGGRERASGLTCPACGGGQSRERSLTAGRDGLRMWAVCHRNKCGKVYRWGPADLDHAGVLVAPPSVLAHRPMAPPTLPLTEACITHVEALYGLHAATIQGYGCRTIAGQGALYVPVRGPQGNARGCVLRQLDGTRPKVKSYPAADYPTGRPWLAWFHLGTLQRAYQRPTIVVEDVLSAMRLEQAGHSAVSLLGTGLSETKALELRRWCPTVVVALDADAIGRAISHALRHSFEVRRLTSDFKDMTEEQLTQWTTSLSSSLPASIRGTPAR